MNRGLGLVATLFLTVALSGCFAIGNRPVKTSDSLRVQTPRPDSTVSSPLGITGEARGFWYFEGAFTVKLLDPDGTILAKNKVEAQSEWTTTEFVPFRGRLQFASAGSASRGRLIFSAANPSGLPRNEKRVVLPVRLEGDPEQ